MLVTAFSMAQSLLRINYGAVTMVAGGVACLLLYITKRKIWSLFLGMFLLCTGLTASFAGIVPGYMLSRFVSASFFVTPALIFLVLFVEQKRKWFFERASFLLYFGVFLILTGLPAFRGFIPHLLIFCLAAAALSNKHLKRLMNVKKGASMSEYGQVAERIDDRHVLVRIERTDACSKCGVCSAGPGRDMYVKARNDDGAVPMEWVSLELEPVYFLAAAALMYGVPFISLIFGFIAGYYGAHFFGGGSASPAVGFFLGLALMILTYMFLHGKEKSLQLERYSPTAARIPRQ
jgi:sigma-E factor negative regulatory protein RseC